jgi:hypothetical protein
MRKAPGPAWHVVPGVEGAAEGIRGRPRGRPEHAKISLACGVRPAGGGGCDNPGLCPGHRAPPPGDCTRNRPIKRRLSVLPSPLPVVKSRLTRVDEVSGRCSDGRRSGRPMHAADRNSRAAARAKPWPRGEGKALAASSAPEAGPAPRHRPRRGGLKKGGPRELVLKPESAVLRDRRTQTRQRASRREPTRPRGRGPWATPPVRSHEWPGPGPCLEKVQRQQ